MRQVLRAGALGRPRGIGWRRRWEGGSGWGTHINPWLIHVNVWQKSLQYCKVTSLQLIKINGKKRKRKNLPAMQKTRFDSWVEMICWRRESLPTPVLLGFPCGSAGKELACNVGDLGSIPGLGRSPGEGKGYPLQYSWVSLVVQLVKNLPAMWETWVLSLGWEGFLE